MSEINTYAKNIAKRSRKHNERTFVFSLILEMVSFQQPYRFIHYFIRFFMKSSFTDLLQFCAWAWLVITL